MKCVFESFYLSPDDGLAGPSAYCASKLVKIYGCSMFHLIICNLRSAVVRTIGCLQLEMDAEHDGSSGVHLYAVHPGILSLSIASTALFTMIAGSVKTPMTTTDKVAHLDMDKMKPGVRHCHFLRRTYLKFTYDNHQSFERVQKNFASFGDS